MFHSSSSSSSSPSPSCGDPYRLPVVCCPAAPPQALYDAGGSHPLLFSSSPPYSSSLPSYYYHHLPRSSSTHSLSLPHGIPDLSNQQHFFSYPQHHHHHHPPQPPPQPPQPSSSPSSSSGDYLDFNAGPVRRVFSTGDLQGMNGMQASGDNYNQEGTAIPGRVGRYSAEERKERIERYRSKRNQRNFHKKITYACRKTLADSRPRVRGRFARNGETETETEPEVEAEVTENNHDRYSSYNNYEQTPIAGGGVNGDGDWWRQMQAALATEVEEECYYDEELWANFSDISSVNLPS
ncbi:two-component response regulator-like APRR1 [Phoenix dactylifera]|uniref:Two-component response regulator-like APRR1 n=1 Tax=Phoenix dactylifera TaxID=42345 RepID=A0A8B8IZF5_PHODC|nr:two-component response regulator-like APRR1 [Phoenix dactylifera]